MSDKPAFARPSSGPDERNIAQEGATLHDLFAAAALTGLLANPYYRNYGDLAMDGYVCSAALSIADKMIELRDEKRV